MTIAQACDAVFRIAVDHPLLLEALEPLCPFPVHSRTGLLYCVAMSWIYVTPDLDAAQDDHSLIIAMLRGLWSARHTPMGDRPLQMLADQVTAEMERLGVL